MNTKELLKKFWFVIVIAVLFLVFIGVYAINTINNKPINKVAKEIDGNYIIYTIEDQNYTADELYESLKANFGLTTIYRTFDRLVCDTAVETTKDMKDIATSNAQYLLQYYGQDKLNEQMKSLGYKDANDAYNYYIDLQKSLALRTDYLKAHESEYVTPYINENDPKIISHILVKVVDIEKITNEDGTTTFKANPTQEEQAKLDKVLEELKTQDFATVATNNSDDGSASNGGNLGYFDNKNTTFVSAFKDVAKTVKEGETSEVFTSEYGYHIIYCNSQKLDDLYADSNFMNAIFSANQNLYNKPLVEKAKELNIKIEDESLNALLFDTISGSEETK